MRILLVDDDVAMVEALKRLLEAEKYVVDVAYDGISGWDLITGWEYDLILLDVMLPKLDGITFCSRLRKQNNSVLVMLLTARDTMTDKIVGLDSGADDYVIKPFNPQELAARIRALIRRKTTSTSPIITCGDLTLDPNLLEVNYQGKILEFSRKEYLIVELFLRNQKRVYDCRDIVEHLWNFDAEPPNESTVRSHIKNIRRQLKYVGAESLLETVYGKGYRINPGFTSVNNTSVDVSQKENLDQAIAEIWLGSQDLYFERLMILENFVASFKKGDSNQKMYEEAIQVSHKLAGSLGIFGFDKGSALSRKIEKILEPYVDEVSRLKPSDCSQIVSKIEPLFLALQHELKAPLDVKISQIEPQRINAKILAVDDDIQILMFLRKFLEPTGVQLTCLSNTDNFWNNLTSTQPDFLILDINIPNANEGLNICKSIREHNQWSWLPVLFLTSCTDTNTLQEAFVIGADDVLNKPIDCQELLVRIKNRYERFLAIKSYVKN